MTDRDRLIELLKPHVSGTACLCESGSCELTSCGDCKARRLADYLLANGVIVPPCKVGDTVYEIQPIRQRVQSYKITTLKWNGFYWWFTWIIKDHNGIYGNVEGFNNHQIGKTVFLTKEEAENALVTDTNVGSKKEREGK